jgi:SAM-dependent methyltransferase
MPPHPDKHILYELCVQSPIDTVPMLRAMHGGDPRVLSEDFAGSAALSYLWADSAPDARAIAVDLDEAALMRRPDHLRVARIVGDVRTATNAAEHPCDVLFVGNFSIGYLHTRPELVAYLRHARSRLKPGGVFVCEIYGGESAFLTGEVTRDHRLPDGRRVRYTWEQREANPLTGMVTDVLHFRVERAGRVECKLPDAFVYRWRLWSVPELRDAMVEAGFSTMEVYDRTPDATDAEGNAFMIPVSGDEDVEDSFIVCVAGRADSLARPKVV